MVLSIFGINYFSLIFLFLMAFFASFGLPGALFVMIILGALAKGFSDILLISLFGLAGAIMGDILAYEFARSFQNSFHSKLERFSFFKNNEKKAKNMLRTQMFYLIFFTRFAMRTISAVVNYVSGFKKIERKWFVPTIIAGEIIYAIVYPLIGFFFKQSWRGVIDTIWEFSIIVLLVLFIVLLIKKIMQERKLLKSSYF